jgi:hypothetical protein
LDPLIDAEGLGFTYLILVSKYIAASKKNILKWLNVAENYFEDFAHVDDLGRF